MCARARRAGLLNFDEAAAAGRTKGDGVVCVYV